MNAPEECDINKIKVTMIQVEQKQEALDAKIVQLKNAVERNRQ